MHRMMLVHTQTADIFSRYAVVVEHLLFIICYLINIDLVLQKKILKIINGLNIGLEELISLEMSPKSWSVLTFVF